EFAAELARFRAEVAALTPAPAAEGNGQEILGPNLVQGFTDADHLAADNLLDTTSAKERFGYPRKTIAKRCRTGSAGVSGGGRWLVSVPRLQRRLNGKFKCAVRSSMFMLGVPFGPWTAHVVQLRPIGVKQGLGQTLEEFDDRHWSTPAPYSRRLVVPRAAG